MFYKLPKSLWTGVKNRLVNVPIFESDVEETIKMLPRTPGKAGLKKVKLKRMKSMKTSHIDQLIDVEKIIKALNLFINTKNKRYRNMSIIPDYEDFVRDNDLEGYFMINPQDEILSDDEESNNTDSPAENINDSAVEDKSDENEVEDPMHKWKFDFAEKTTFVNDYPELDIIDTIEHSNSDEPIIVAPGEGKRPENILRSQDWDLGAFPNLHPDGRNGLHEPRTIKITDIQYFQQRLLNVDRRFCNNSEFLFAAHGYLEMRRLESNLNISYMRGKKNARGEYSLEDAYSVLENMPGTPKYWQKKKLELIGKLYNLGPFPLFFTLSCAEKRWNENFTTFLQEHDVTYIFQDNKEQCFVDGMPLEEFLQKEENISKHEYIRRNILNVTLNFDKRVKEFIKTIVMNKNSPLPVTKYNYRVEFQLRVSTFSFIFELNSSFSMLN